MQTAFDIFNSLQTAPEGAVLPSLSAYKPGQVIKSPEEIRRDWLMLRVGKFTASEFHRLMGYQGKNELPAGGRTYALEKALELMTEFEPDTYVSTAMQWGIDHEAEAVDAFMLKTGLKVEAHGNAQHFLQLGASIGGTPDGLIPSLQSGIEVKCPNSKTHLDYLGIVDAESLKASAPEYYWQCQGLMMINQSDFWYFVSYDPRFRNEKLRLHVARIARVESDIHDLRVRLDMAIKYRNEIVGRFADE